MAIWKQDVNIGELNGMGRGTLAEAVGIEFDAAGEDWLRAKMPVDARTRQPYGLLHGGASAALAENVGSMASSLCLGPGGKCVGIEINANHVRPAKEGYVYGTARPLSLGRTIHVWDIRVTDGEGKLVCVSRLTVAVLDAGK